MGPSQMSWNKAVQERVSVTSNALESMKGIKMMGLTLPLSKEIQDLRVKELEISKSFRKLIAWMNANGEPATMENVDFVPDIISKSCLVSGTVHHVRDCVCDLGYNQSCPSFHFVGGHVPFVNFAGAYLQRYPTIWGFAGLLREDTDLSTTTGTQYPETV